MSGKRHPQVGMDHLGANRAFDPAWKLADEPDKALMRGSHSREE